MKRLAFLFVVLFTLHSSVAADVACSSRPFGAANDFNLFVLDSLRTSNTDVQGRAAVGGNADVSNYSVGQKLPVPARPAPYAFIVGNTLTARHGSVHGGAVAVGGTMYSDDTFSMKYGGYKAYPLDFHAAANHLRNLSRAWGAMKAQGGKVVEGATITLVGGAHGLNVFTLSSEELSRATYLKLDVPARSLVLVNVTGRAAAMRHFGFAPTPGGNPAAVYNFFEARTLELRSLALSGTVLAPFAQVLFDEGRIDGQLLADAVEGTGQMNVATFAGCWPTGTP